MLSAMRASLRFDDGRSFDLSECYRSPGRRLSIGRVDTHKPDVALKGTSTSRTHAYITFCEREGSWTVMDRSANGTSLDGVRIEPKVWSKLSNGAVLRFSLADERAESHDVATLEITASGLPRSAATRRASFLPLGRGAFEAEAGVAAVPRSEAQECLARAAKRPQEDSVEPHVAKRARQSIHSAPIDPGLPPGYTRPSVQPPSSAGPCAGSRRSAGPSVQPPAGGGHAGGVKRPSMAPEELASTAKKCDKCDGPHATDACPHFSKPREDHKDAWLNYGRKDPLTLGRPGGRLIVRGGRVVTQPGDGSCLFHSLCFGLRRKTEAQAQQLRRQLADFVMRNASREIAGDTIEEWIRWDTSSSVAEYTRMISVRGWGGGIEMAACSIMYGVNVHVYEPRNGGTAFQRISCFDSPVPTNTTINVLYRGGMHFDALVLNR